ncbi:MAG: T9SS type A sorting domain-containing protein, partial [bacterium]|nr:T9SS type A sorting domain-containing protein [bacterium]
SVSLYDLDGDGVLEVFVATDQVYAWQGNGTLMPGFPVAFSGSQYGGCSTSAAGDVDGDGNPEIVVEGWEYLNAFNNDGSIVSGFPYALPGGQGFSYSAPSLVDIDNDGSLEIFCASHGSPNSWLYGLRGNGTSLPGFPNYIEGWTYSTPAIGDLDGDGQVEIALLCNSGLLYAFETNGSPMAGWPVNMGHYNCEGALAMADIDNNNQMDVLFGNNGGTAYQYLCYRADGTPHPDFPFATTGASLPSCSSIADADNDGNLEIAFHTGNGAVNLWTAPYAASGAALPWPQPHHDVQHTGNYHHGAVTHDITVDLTPLNPPITIPTGGGSFSYTITIVNHENNPVSAQFWTMLRLPNGNPYGPIVGPITRTVGALDSIGISRSLYIPGRAPAGNYTYTGYIGQYPGSVWNDDSFPFIKAGDQVMGNGEWVINDEEIDDNSSQHDNLALSKVSPNPFNPSTVISYNLQNSANVNLSVYNIAGRLVEEVINSRQEAGDHQITFDGSKLASGIYLYRITSGSQIAVGKLVLLK